MKQRLKELFAINFTIKNSIMLAIACAINLGLFLMTYYLGLPVILDTVGTAYISFFLGPTAGIIVAIVNSFSQFIFYNVYSLVYVFVGIAISLFVGICSRLGKFKDFFQVFGILFCCYIINVLTNSLMPLVGINLRSGDYWILYFSTLFETFGLTEYLSVLLANVIMKLPDTLVSAALVLLAYVLTPKSFREEMLSHHRNTEE